MPGQKSIYETFLSRTLPFLRDSLPRADNKSPRFQYHLQPRGTAAVSILPISMLKIKFLNPTQKKYFIKKRYFSIQIISILFMREASGNAVLSNIIPTLHKSNLET
jgi:hypothetical protein